VLLGRIGGVNLSDASTVSALKLLVEQEGFAVVPVCLDEGMVHRLCEYFDDSRHPQRNLLSVPSVRRLATSKPVHEVMEAILGSKCFAIRGIFSIGPKVQIGRSFGTKT
jgi:hypothetical protein